MTTAKTIEEMTETSKPLSGKRICFLGRGGAGKSTSVVLAAEALCAYGYEVCVLDADSTNIGLHKALGIKKAPKPLVEYFGGMVFQGGLVSCPVDDPSLITEPVIDLDKLPVAYQSRNEEGITLLQTGKLAEFGVGAGCDGPMVKLARDIRIQRGDRPVALLVDFKAGLEDTSRGVLVGMDIIVAVCDPSMAAIQTTIALNKVLAAQRVGCEPSTSHLETPALVDLMRQLYREWHPGKVYVVLNKMPDKDAEDYVRKQLEDAGIEVTVSIPEKKNLRNAWMRGNELVEADTQPLGLLVERLETDLQST